MGAGEALNSGDRLDLRNHFSKSLIDPVLPARAIRLKVLKNASVDAQGDLLSWLREGRHAWCGGRRQARGRFKHCFGDRARVFAWASWIAGKCHFFLAEIQLADAKPFGSLSADSSPSLRQAYQNRSWQRGSFENATPASFDIPPLLRRHTAGGIVTQDRGEPAFGFG
jgi:hypothetical protein